MGGFKVKMNEAADGDELFFFDTVHGNVYIYNFSSPQDKWLHLYTIICS